MLHVLRITIIGTPVPDPDGGPFNIGRDNVETYFAILPDDHDDFDWESMLSMEIVCTIPTLGM